MLIEFGSELGSFRAAGGGRRVPLDVGDRGSGSTVGEGCRRSEFGVGDWGTVVYKPHRKQSANGPRAVRGRSAGGFRGAANGDFRGIPRGRQRGLPREGRRRKTGMQGPGIGDRWSPLRSEKTGINKYIERTDLDKKTLFSSALQKQQAINTLFFFQL